MDVLCRNDANPDLGRAARNSNAVSWSGLGWAWLGLGWAAGLWVSFLSPSGRRLPSPSQFVRGNATMCIMGGLRAVRLECVRVFGGGAIMEWK